MESEKLNEEQNKLLTEILLKFDAIVDGIKAEMTQRDETGKSWLRFLKRNYARNFPKRFVESGGQMQSNFAQNPDKLRRHGLRLQVDTAQTIVAALSMRIDFLTQQLKSKKPQISVGDAIVGIHDCCRMALVFGQEKRISVAPNGWKMDPIILQNRQAAIEQADQPIDAEACFDFIELFGNKAGGWPDRTKIQGIQTGYKPKQMEHENGHL